MLHTALRSPQFKAAVPGGLPDRYSWIPQLTGQPDVPLIFDSYYQPKRPPKAFIKRSKRFAKRPELIL